MGLYPDIENSGYYLISDNSDISVDAENQAQDGNPGTFYSAISNINFSIADGKSNAVVLRTHYAQY